MQDTDSRSFAEAMMVLSEAFNEPVSSVRIEAYFVALSDLDAPAVLGAMRMALRSCHWFPKPAEIRELVEGDPESRADGAWGYLLDGIRQVGYMGFPAFDDARITIAVRDVWGSWGNLCSTLPSEGPELVGWMKQFKSAYQSAGKRVEQARLEHGVPAGVLKSLSTIAEQKRMK